MLDGANEVANEVANETNETNEPYLQHTPVADAVREHREHTFG